MATSPEPTAEMFILRGKIAWSLELIDAGNRDFRTASEMEPHHPEVKLFETQMFAAAEQSYEEALFLAEGGEFTKAITLLDEALLADQNDVRCLVLRSRAKRALGRVEEAMRDVEHASTVFKRAMSIQKKGGRGDPSSVPLRKKNQVKDPYFIVHQRNLILNDLAMEYVEKEEHSYALALLNQIIESESEFLPQEEDDSNESVNQQHQQQKQKSGDIIMVTGKKKKKRVPQTFFINRGDVLRSLKKYLPALSDYTQALEQSPESWEISTRVSIVHYLIGSQLFNKGDYKRSEEEISRALEFNSKISEYFLLRGQARYIQADYNGAFSDFEECLRLNPDQKEAKKKVMQFKRGGSDEQEATLGLDEFSSQIQEDNFQGDNLLLEMDRHRLSNKHSFPAPQPPPRSLNPTRTVLPLVNPFVSEKLIEAREEMNQLTRSTCGVVRNTESATMPKGQIWKSFDPSRYASRVVKGENRWSMGGEMKLKTQDEKRREKREKLKKRKSIMKRMPLGLSSIEQSSSSRNKHARGRKSLLPLPPSTIANPPASSLTSSKQQKKEKLLDQPPQSNHHQEHDIGGGGGRLKPLGGNRPIQLSLSSAPSSQLWESGESILLGSINEHEEEEEED